MNVGNLQAEAAAFDHRITERVAAGFIPDLRRAVRCDHFYKSFWRDPLFIRLYLGRIVDAYLDLLARHVGPGCRILDVGCGAGYVSLELARAGHHVTAIDISAANIDVARRMLAENPFTQGFGSLDYRLQPFHEAEGDFDVVLFSMSLHHMPDVPAVVERAWTLLPPGGWLLCHEPCHERFAAKDAAQVALIRTLLAATGHWHDPAEPPAAAGDPEFLAYVRAVQAEYVHERDINEPEGQSPHDLEADGAEMIAAITSRFRIAEERNGHSFIYRLLGGIRGDEATVERLARVIDVYDRMAVEHFGLSPNHFTLIGRKDQAIT
ncbi:MAG: methyltransferase domain-containing protein [Rhodospirillaceae bacterium]|nr:methyltransferase domain-containing protein [Rhodospirillales bacterium]